MNSMKLNLGCSYIFVTLEGHIKLSLLYCLWLHQFADVLVAIYVQYLFLCSDLSDQKGNP